MIRFMGAAEAITLEQGTIYLKIQMLGFVFLALTSTMTATLRGVGLSLIHIFLYSFLTLFLFCQGNKLRKLTPT